MRTLRTSCHPTLRLAVEAGLALALVHCSGPGARAAELVIYDTPAVITSASAHPDPDAQPISYLNIDGTPSGAEPSPKFANSVVAGAMAAGTAVRGLDGFAASAIASGRSGAFARTFSEWLIDDPQNRGSITLEMDFSAVSAASYPGHASWSVQVSEPSLLTPYYVVNDNGEITSFGEPGHERPIYYLALGGVRALNSGGYEAATTVLRNDQVESTIRTDSNVVHMRETITLNVTGDTVLLIKVHAAANGVVSGSGATMVDPVLRPHADNPDVIVEMQAAEGPTPESPFAGLTPEGLLAQGIDPQPFADYGFIDPLPPDVEAPCTGGMSLARPRLALRASVPPARSELRLKGQIALSPAPESPFDPIVSGARVLLEDATGGIVLDETVPGGAFDPDTLIGWRHDTETGRWIYAAPPSQGVQRLVLRRVAGRDDAYRFRLKASLVPTALPTPEELPLKATLVLDPPVARNGQCGEAYFGGGPSGPECSTYGESRLVCR